MNGSEIALALVSVLCSTAGQVAFKAAANRNFPRAIPFLSCGVSLMLVSVLVAVMILRTVPLSAMVPFAALAYVTTPLAAMLIFNESIKKQFWLGTLFIIAGIMLTLT
jgi:undecaprenyl phosphate-alpha-L-ara4N flippase subunit ArnE